MAKQAMPKQIMLFLIEGNHLTLFKNVTLMCFFYYYYYFFHRCLSKLKQEFVQDLMTKYGGEHLGEIDMDS